jgi:hypothetical protein
MSGRPCCDGTRVFACALVTGLPFAALAGFQAGQSAGADGASTNTSVRVGFAPAPAVVGFLAGALAGAGVGFVWSRPGFVGLVGLALVAALGGLVGLVVAGLAGAESRTVVAGNSASMEYGAPSGVLVGGAAAGVVVGMLAAWWLRPRATAG